MQKAYSRINWHNEPSTETALGANNLNKVDKALDTIDDRVLSLYGYESRAAESEKNAKESEINAKTSETNAKQSELLAKEYADSAFIATPEGYREVLELVEENKSSINSVNNEIGNADISNIGNGTITDAISSINEDLNNKIKITDSPNAYCEVKFPIADNDYYSLGLKPSSLSYSYFDSDGVEHPYWNFEPLKNLLNNPKPLTAEDDVLALEPGVYKADNLLALNGQSANAVYIVLWGRDGADRHILEFGANTGTINYNQMMGWSWRGWQTLNNNVTVDSYARVVNSDGASVGNVLKTHQSAKPIYIIDPQNPSYYWYGIFYHDGKKFLLNEISKNGLEVQANAYGTISPSGGSGSYTFLNMIPTSILW